MKTEPRLILAVLFAVLLVGIAVYEFAQIINIETQAQNILLEAETRSGNDFRTRSIKLVQNSSQDDITTLRSAALNKSGLVSLVDSLEKTGQTMGLRVSISSIKGETDTVWVKVETDGAWSSSLVYIHLLESLPYKAIIEETSLNVSGRVWHSSSLLRLTLLPEKT